MRTWILAFVAGCGGYAPGQVPAGTLCVSLEGSELCADAAATVTEAGGETRILVQAEVAVPGAELGYDRVDARIEVLHDVATGTARGEVSVVPALLTCLLDISHGGDHCHLGIPTDRGCEVAVQGSDFRSVEIDEIGANEVRGRFSAKVDAAPPSCCASNCAEVDRPAGVEPEGPWRIDGAFSVPISPAN